MRTKILLRLIPFLVALVVAQAGPAHAQSGAAGTPTFKPAPADPTPPPPQAAPAPAPPPPGYAYPGYPPYYGYPPPGYAYPGYPPYAYPNAYTNAPPPQQPGWHSHDGFFLNISGGFGGFSYTTNNNGTKGTLTGSAVSLEGSMGAAVTPHLIVFGTLYEVNSMNSSTFKVSGNGNNNTESTDNVTLVGFGPGVTYYIGEHNYYLSGALALSRLRLETGLIGIDRNSGDSDWGVTVKATFGKEWWVSDNWGLGLAGQVVLGSIKDSKILGGVNTDAPAPNASWSVAAFNVLFSASFN